MMFPLPFSRFRLDSSLPPSEVFVRLRSRLVDHSISERVFFDIERMFGRAEGQATPDLFGGSLDEPNLSFKFSRLISYRNSFLPVLTGTVRPSTNGNGSEVHVFGRPAWFATAFMALWVALTSAMMLGASAGGEPLLLRLGMPMFGIALYVGGFVPEFIKARKVLQSILEQSKDHAPIAT